MERVCFVMKIKKELVEQYLKAHDVWPEMKQAVSEAGIRNYSLFIHPDGLAVGYFESDNPQESLARLGQTQINTRWQKYIGKYFEHGSGDLKNQTIEWLKQYFHLE